MEFRIVNKDEYIQCKEFLSRYNAALEECNGRLFYLCKEKEDIIAFMAIDHLSYISVLEVDRDYYDMGVGETMIRIAENLCIDRLMIKEDRDDFLVRQGFVYDEEKDCLIKYPVLEGSFNNYDDVYKFIMSQKSRVYSLDHFKAFMKSLYDPQLGLCTVHIGGTNGKGSTTNYTKEVLMRAGYKVGTFTTPALIKRTDITKVNDVAIDEDTIVQYANRFMKRWISFELSLFEIEVMITVLYFIEQGVDIALFEVGLGGELDATNIIHPLLCVNTNIGLDHIDYLGDSYESIARTKAGIVKDGIDYMTGDHRDIVLTIFKEVTDSHHSQLIEIKPPKDVTYEPEIEYDYMGYHVHLNTNASYQVDNSALAINILEYIKKEFPYTRKDLEEGLYQAKWAGRFEKICDDPLIIIDGAHNKEGMEAFVKTASKYPCPKIIFSALKDKDYHHMLEMLLELSDDVTVTEFPHVRRAEAETLAEDFPVKIEKDWHKAVDEALKYKGTIFITGSLYFISMVRSYIIDIRNRLK